MKYLNSIISSILVLGVIFSTTASDKNFHYRSKIKDVQNTWHSLLIPDTVASKTKNSFSDLRLYGINTNDTIEIPYFIEEKKTVVEQKSFEFKIINETQTERGRFYTFKVTNPTLINQIELDFNHDNFDMKLSLEGSDNNGLWFTIAKDYRVLSILDKYSNYKQTTLNFRDIHFKYLRLFVPNLKNPKLKLAGVRIWNHQKKEGKYYEYNTKFSQKDDAQKKQTVLIIDLGKKVPVSKVSISVTDSLDYYRKVFVKYLSGYTQTHKGKKEKYTHLSGGYLSSLEKKPLSFHNVVTDKLQLIIQNLDNQPLSINSVLVKGNVYELTARFPKADMHYMYYGNEALYAPNYDISHFEDKIPKDLTSLKLGKEETLQEVKATKKPLIISPTYLWLIIGIIILVLGWFLFKMMRNNPNLP